MENFLLWLLRTLLILLLAAGFALPVVRSGRLAMLGAARRDVAIVWDISYSMSYESAGRRVWEDARGAVLQILGGLNEGDRAAVFLAGAQTIPLVAQPNADLKFVESLVRQQTLSPTPSSLMPALRAAVASLKASGSREREIYIVTDGQASAWEGFAAVSNAAVASGDAWDPSEIDDRSVIVAALLGAATPDNAAPVDADLQPRLLVSGQAGRLAARVIRSRADAETSLTLAIDGREVARQTVPPGDLAGEVVFTLPPLPPGRHPLVVATAPDGLPIDDEFHLLVNVLDRVPVVCVGEEADMAFLLRALQPGGRAAGFDVKIVPPAPWGGAALQGALCVFLCNAAPLPGPAIVDLERYLRAGGLVALVPGDRAGAADYENLTWLPARPTGIEDIRPGQGRRTLRLRAPDDPLFDGLKLPPGVIPTLAVRRRLTLATPAPDASVLVAMEGDVPFLLARPLEAGRVLLFTVSADRAWSNWPLTPMYLPLLHQVARLGAGLAREAPWVTVEREVEVPPSAGSPPPARLIGPDGTPVAVRAILREGRTVGVMEEISAPGIYMAEDEAAGRRPVLAINLDRRESDLAPLDPDTVPRRIGFRRVAVAKDLEDLARRIEELRVGRPMAETMLWAALVVSVLEFLLANRVSRRTAARRMKWIVEPSGRVRTEAEA